MREPTRAGRAAPALLVLILAACSAQAEIPASSTAATTTSPASADASTTTATGLPPAATTTSTATTEPPPGKNPLCLRRADFGDPAESEYILPFPVGESYLVTQSYCASGRPGGHSEQLAYDFYLPVGAEVIAARGGWVRAVREEQPDTGRGVNLNNYVFIEHADHSAALYAHLQQFGVDVEVGQYVRRGERIAASGNSGATGGIPHLHFGVYRRWPDTEDIDGIAVSFRNAEGPLDSLGGLLLSRHYTALPWEE